MNSTWNNNYCAFQKRFPQLAQMTGSTPVPPESLWTLEKAKNSMLTASEGGIRLHSAYNPEREAFSAVTRPEVFEKSSVVFYGFGLGYHVIEWAKAAISRQKENKYNHLPRLILIEPDVRHFFAALCILDWSPVFKLENLVLAVGAPAESVLPLLEDASKVNIGQTGVSDAYYFDIPPFCSHAKSYFDTVRSIIKRNQRKNEINAATLKKFGKRWCKNSVKNLDNLEKLGFISSLQGRAVYSNNCEPLPFLIIGAGPSLKTMLPYLKELQKRMLIICVETALHTLLRNKVQPDFIILTDPQYWAYRHIAPFSAPQSILITELSAYLAVFRFKCSNILLCASQFPVGQYVQTKLNINSGDLGTGGSVASCAWNFAKFCGAKTIYTAGLDFAFPDGQTHIKGSSAEQTYHTISNRLSSADEFTANTLYSANAIISKDYNGNPVITDSRMKMFSWWFESRLASCPEVQTFTLCPQGLNTPGIKPAEITEVISLPEITEQKTDFINFAKKIKSDLSSDQLNKLHTLIKDFPTVDFFEAYDFLREYF